MSHRQKRKNPPEPIKARAGESSFGAVLAGSSRSKQKKLLWRYLPYDDLAESCFEDIAI